LRDILVGLVCGEVRVRADAAVVRDVRGVVAVAGRDLAQARRDLARELVDVEG